MPEPPPEDLLLRPLAADQPMPDKQDSPPRWARGEITTRRNQVVTAVLAPVPIAVLFGLAVGEWAVGGMVLFLLELIVFLVLLGCIGGVVWDETGVTLTLFGWKRKHLPWSTGLTIGMNKLELDVDGKTVAQPMYGLASKQDKAWFAAAVLQHGPPASTEGLDKRQRTKLYTRLFNTALSIKKQWSALAERQPPPSSMRPGIYVSVVKEATLGEFDPVASVVFVGLVMLGLTFFLMSKGTSLIPFFISCLLLGSGVTVVRRRNRVSRESGYNKSDTIEVTDKGVRVWRAGQPTALLQYPRHLTVNPGRRFPGGEVEVWSDGEQTYAIDWRYLGRLPDDAPPCFVYAATEGDGWPDEQTKEAAIQLQVVRSFGVLKR